MRECAELPSAYVLDWCPHGWEQVKLRVLRPVGLLPYSHQPDTGCLFRSAGLFCRRSGNIYKTLFPQGALCYQWAVLTYKLMRL